MAIPVNREIHLLMHCQGRRTFFLRARACACSRILFPAWMFRIHFTATKVGKYEIVCTQLCGLGHYNMKAYLDVMSQNDFDDWLKQQAAMQ